ncbi:MAG TPA: hypothetical protein VN643_25625 [Pyrinomonadaceae bacterium]|nr:hypothetical protein [Pyrinomonadaceae bacterium]
MQLGKCHGLDPWWLTIVTTKGILFVLKDALGLSQGGFTFYVFGFAKTIVKNHGTSPWHPQNAAALSL